MDNITPEILVEKVEKCKDSQSQADLFMELGLIDVYRKKYSEAIDYFEKAQKKYLDTQDVDKIASCLAELALAHYKQSSNRLIRSHTLLNDAKYLIENNKTEENREVRGKIIHYYGIISYSEYQYSEALTYYKKAQEILSSDCIEYAKLLDSLSVFYLRSANYPIAIKYLQESLNIKNKLKNSIELAKTQLLLGRYYVSIENYEEARKTFNSAVEISKVVNDTVTVARINDELAKISINIDNFKEARQFSEIALGYSDNNDTKFVHAFSLCTYARILLLENNPQEVLNILYDSVVAIFEKANSTRGNALVKQIFAETYRMLGDIDKSIEFSHESIELYSKISLNIEVVKSYYELAVTYKQSDNIQMAVSSLLEALRVAKANELPLMKQKIEDFLYEIDIAEWSLIVEKSARKEKALAENKTLLEALDLVGTMSSKDIVQKDPLLALLRVGRSISAETNVDTLMSIIAEETKAALNADRCTVFMLDKETNELWSKVALGMGSQEIRFPADMGLAGYVVKNGQTVNIKDAYNDDRFNKEIDKQTGYKTRTILCMPVRNINHEIVGVFQVLNKAGNKTFSDKDEDLLLAIGSSAGIALENARLFNKQTLIFEEQKKSFTSFIKTLAASIDARDKITAGHSLRVTKYTALIAKQMRIKKDDIEVLEYAAALHDIGKIGIRDVVLFKEGKLTPEEYEHIQEHVKITYDILSTMYFEKRFKDVPIIASSHHEKYDGSGYFRGSKADDIPLGGRILAVADVFDAITSKRHYRDKMPMRKVLDIIATGADSHFDSKIVKDFFNIPINSIATVLASAKDIKISTEDRKFFKPYNTETLYEVLQKEESELLDDEKILVETFNKYYYV